MVSHFYWHAIGYILYTAWDNRHIYCLTICIVKYLRIFVCLLALEYCCSFHLFACIFPVFDLHAVHLSSFKVFKYFLTLPFSIQLVPKVSWIYILYIYGLKMVYIYIYIYIYIHQNDKERKPSYQVLKVSCKHVSQSSVCT